MCNSHFITFLCSHATRIDTPCPKRLADPLASCEQTTSGDHSSFAFEYCPSCEEKKNAEEERRKSNRGIKGLARRGVEWIRRDSHGEIIPPVGNFNNRERLSLPVGATGPIPEIGTRTKSMPIGITHIANPREQIDLKSSSSVGSAPGASSNIPHEFDKRRIRSTESEMEQNYQHPTGENRPGFEKDQQFTYAQSPQLERTSQTNPDDRPKIRRKSSPPTTYESKQAPTHSSKQGDHSQLIDLPRSPPAYHPRRIDCPRIAQHEMSETDRMSTVTRMSAFMDAPLVRKYEPRRQGSQLRDGSFDHRQLVPDPHTRKLRQDMISSRRGDDQEPAEVMKTLPYQKTSAGAPPQRQDSSKSVGNLQMQGSTDRRQTAERNYNPHAQWSEAKDLREEVETIPRPKLENSGINRQCSPYPRPNEDRLNARRANHTTHQPVMHWLDTQGPPNSTQTSREPESPFNSNLQPKAHSSHQRLQNQDNHQQDTFQRRERQRLGSSDHNTNQSELSYPDRQRTARSAQEIKDEEEKHKKDKEEEYRRAEIRLNQVRDGRGTLNFSLK